MTDGELDKSRYRRFRIKTRAGAGRLRQHVRGDRAAGSGAGLEDGDLPDLLVIDGGKGQLASAHAAMKDVGVEAVDVVGLAKSRELDVRRPRAPARARSPERMFVPGQQGPHRPAAELARAVHAHAHARRGAPLRHHLPAEADAPEELPVACWRTSPAWARAGRRRCCAHFGSLKRIREASIEELAAQAGLGTTLAERIHAHLHAPESELRREVAEGQVDQDAVREASLEDAASDRESRPRAARLTRGRRLMLLRPEMFPLLARAAVQRLRSGNELDVDDRGAVRIEQRLEDLLRSGLTPASKKPTTRPAPDYPLRASTVVERRTAVLARSPAPGAS